LKPRVESNVCQPNSACHAGPWTGGASGDVVRLPLEIRLELACKRWVLIEVAGIGFEVES
jgi:hypothetical protein